VTVPLDDVEVQNLRIGLVGGLPGCETAGRWGRYAAAVEAEQGRGESQLQLHVQDAQAAARPGHALEVLGQLVRNRLEARQLLREGKELELFLLLNVGGGGVGASEEGGGDELP
jgi:hypothetical protein